jgi:lipopolysaccharide/colanic/teichoic acid biosynthesis glycosyltransferase
MMNCFAGEVRMAVQVTSGQQIAIRSRYARVKRALDIVFTVLIFIPLCISMAIVAVAIRLDSPGPVFFRQKRVGQNGAEFYMLKFRSMYDNSDDSIHREATAQYMRGELIGEGAAALPYKRSEDPRITRVGRFLRKASLDEIPQFINVLRGEMTLVGPRPPLPYEVERYSARDLVRLRGKPGMTGAWQVYGRSSVTFQSMVEMDIAYLQKQSLREDLKLIALTIPVMIAGRGGA